MNNQKGFTFTELIITLAAFAIVTMAVVPALADLKKLIEADIEKNRWVRLLNYGRSVSQLENSRVILCPMVNNSCVSDTSETWVLFTDPDKSKSLETINGEKILREYQPKKGSTFGYTGNGSPYLRFGSDNSEIYQGMPAGLTICTFGVPDETAWHLTVNIVGRVTIYNERDENGAPLRKKNGTWINASCDA